MNKQLQLIRSYCQWDNFGIFCNNRLAEAVSCAIKYHRHFCASLRMQKDVTRHTEVVSDLAAINQHGQPSRDSHS
eukprot:6195847-Pleurochrysis_carterae.AAC.2